MVRAFLPAVLLLALAAACSRRDGTESPSGDGRLCGLPVTADATSSVDVTDLTQAIDGFAAALYQELRAKPGNVVFSPFSIWTALGMTWTGAAGETAAEMREVLRLPEAAWPAERVHTQARSLLTRVAAAAGPGCELSVANALWPQDGFPLLPAFLDRLRTSWFAPAIAVDYVRDAEAARGTINAWVGGCTRNLIPELLPRGIVDDGTRLTLVNALFLKGLWQSPFDPALTAEAPFTRADGSTVPVPMMRQVLTCPYTEVEDLRILALPYQGDRLQMLVVLPPRPDGLPALEDRLTPAALAAWTRDTEDRTDDVKVFLPRFDASRSLSLNEPLQRLGMRRAFDINADFSGMTGRPDLFVSSVIHQARLEVTEEGTKAAAATAVVMEEKERPDEPIVFRADRPFLFLVRDRETGALLFLGRLTDPKP